MHLYHCKLLPLWAHAAVWCQIQIVMSKSQFKWIIPSFGSFQMLLLLLSFFIIIMVGQIFMAMSVKHACVVWILTFSISLSCIHNLAHTACFWVYSVYSVFACLSVQCANMHWNCNKSLSTWLWLSYKSKW